MRRIEDEAAARRLARAIASDIALYNDEKLRTGQSLEAEIAEGRELFRTRVELEHHRVYDDEIENILGPRLAPAKPNAELTSYRHAPPPTFAPDPELEKSSWAGSMFLVSFVLFVLAAIALWLVRSR